MARNHQSFATIADAYDYKIPWRVFRLIGERSNLPERDTFIAMLQELGCVISSLCFDETGQQVFCGPLVVRQGWRRIVVAEAVDFGERTRDAALRDLDIRHVRAFGPQAVEALPGIGALRDGVLVACHVPAACLAEQGAPRDEAGSTDMPTVASAAG